MFLSHFVATPLHTPKNLPTHTRTANDVRAPKQLRITWDESA